MNARKEHNALDKPYSVYEVHLVHGSDMLTIIVLTYRNLPKTVSYIKETGFTHVEFMPIMSI
jgi:1,4-alpha-glucan branching enzyme